MVEADPFSRQAGNQPDLTEFANLRFETRQIGVDRRFDPADLLDDYPLLPHELLRDRSERLFDQLQTLAANHPQAPVWLIDARGNMTTWPLVKLADPAATRKGSACP